MPSVTSRINQIKQPLGGYIPIKSFTKTTLENDYLLFESENIHASLVGLAVDYLTRIMLGTEKAKVFSASLMGAQVMMQLDNALELMSFITGLDDTSIICTCKLVGYDRCYRAGPSCYRPIESIHPNAETISNIKIMVNRSMDFIQKYGPVIKDGFTFEGGYTKTVSTGDGDFLTNDTLWDFKVLKSTPTSKHTLQIYMYYLMGIHSNHNEFRNIKNVGIFNPRLNHVYLLNISNVGVEIRDKIEREIIGYEKSNL